MFGGLFSPDKTFRAISTQDPSNSKLIQLRTHACSTLSSGNIRLAVRLPEGENLEEWISVNIVDFFNELGLLYSTVLEYCTTSTCPAMSAGPKYLYYWADGVKVIKPISVSAPEYINLLMTWVESQINDESLFPILVGNDSNSNKSKAFNKNFLPTVKVIMKRLFRVYAHIYYCHLPKVIAIGAEEHLTTCFKHFIFFSKEFKLIDDKELSPLKDYIDTLVSK